MSVQADRGGRGAGVAAGKGAHRHVEDRGRASECETRDAAAAFDGAAAHLDPLWAERLVRRLRSGAATREKRWQDDGGGDLAVPQGGPDRVGRGVASEGAGGAPGARGSAVDQRRIREQERGAQIRRAIG